MRTFKKDKGPKFPKCMKDCELIRKMITKDTDNAKCNDSAPTIGDEAKYRLDGSVWV